MAEDEINLALGDVVTRDARRTFKVVPDPSFDKLIEELLPGAPGPIRFALSARRPRVVIEAQPRLRCTRCRGLCWWTPFDQEVGENPTVLCSECWPPLLRAAIEELAAKAAPPEVVVQAFGAPEGGRRG